MIKIHIENILGEIFANIWLHTSRQGFGLSQLLLDVWILGPCGKLSTNNKGDIEAVLKV